MEFIQMIVKVLSSGSKGNSTYIESGKTKILIDVGITYQRIKYELEQINKTVYDIDGVFISHQHHDHIGGVQSLFKKIDSPIFVKKELEKEVKKLVRDDLVNVIDNELQIGDLKITLFNIHMTFLIQDI